MNAQQLTLDDAPRLIEADEFQRLVTPPQPAPLTLGAHVQCGSAQGTIVQMRADGWVQVQWETGEHVAGWTTWAPMGYVEVVA